MKPIGINKVDNFNIGGRVDSSYDGIFDNNVQVIINNNIFGDIQRARIGDMDELYKILKEDMKKSDGTFHSIMNIVYKIVTNYFGTFENAFKRSSNYKTDDERENDTEIGMVSNLKGQNAGICVERAMVSQNLLKSLGIESYYKASTIINNGKMEGHAYNIIKYDDKYYIYDATMPRLMDEEITPIITEIPKEVFDSIIKPFDEPLQDTIIPVQVDYYNPIKREQKCIVYNSSSKNDIYIANKKIETL